MYRSTKVFFSTRRRLRPFISPPVSVDNFLARHSCSAITVLMIVRRLVLITEDTISCIFPSNMGMRPRPSKSRPIFRRCVTSFGIELLPIE